MPEVPVVVSGSIGRIASTTTIGEAPRSLGAGEGTESESDAGDDGPTRAA
jgi:hypothetical protein